jgi:hypothetical protein
MRRYLRDDYPEYIDSNFNHVSDGFTHIAREGKCGVTLAFETEINVKAKGNYVNLYLGYWTEAIHYVLWLVPKLTSANRIYRYLNEEKEAHEEGPHHVFITYPQFFKLGWGAPIVCGHHEGESIRWIMKQLLTNYPTTSSQPVANNSLLNLSKTPYKSKTYKFYEIGDFAK